MGSGVAELTTKLSRYCETLIEAGWLAALVLVPLFFNVYSARVFEPDKITLLRSITLVMIAAWIVMQVERATTSPAWSDKGWRDGLRTWLRTPLVLPTLALVAVYLVSTIFSVSPRVSLLGSYQRLQGTYTLLSYIIVFAMLLAIVRRQEQVDRLVTVAILTSVPIALYGLLQRAGADPLPWGGDVVTRVAGNMGNAIFIAAYLIMVFPLTVGRIVESFSDMLRREQLNGYDVVRAAGYVIVLVLQTLTIYFSGSRGPWIGWFAGLFFLGLLLALYWRARWLMFGVIATAIAGLVFLIVLNLPNSPLAELRKVPYLGRLGTIFEIEGGTGKVRVLIWEGTVDLISPHEPLVFPDGSQDPYNALRPLIGYGPESMYVAYNRFYPPDLAHLESRNASPDRAHNETLDALAITGVLGLVVQLFLYGAVFYYGLKALGLMRAAIQRWLFVGLYVGGGLIATIVAWRAAGEEFIGVGLPTGIAFGVLIYLAISVLFFYGEGMARLSHNRQLLLIALLGGIIAHFIEIHFGIAIAATRLYFWTYSGLIVAIGYLIPQMEATKTTPEREASVADRGGSPRPAPFSPQPGGKKRSRRRRAEQVAGGRLPVGEDWLSPTLALAAILGLILITIGFEFITNPPRDSSTWDVLVTSLTTLQRQNGATSYGALGLVLLAWLMCSGLAAAELARQGVFSRPGATWQAGTATVAGVSGALAFACYMIIAGTLSFIVSDHSSALVGIQGVKIIAGRIANMLSLFYLFVFATVALVAWLLLRPSSSGLRRWSTGGTVASVVALLVMPWLIVTTNLNIIIADIVYKQADPYEKQAASLRTATDPQQRQLEATSWEAAVTLHEQALTLAPNEDYYYLFLGRADLELAAALDDPAAQDRLLQTAREKLLDAQVINPLNTDHAANLARLNRRWADILNARAAQYDQMARTAQANKNTAEVTQRQQQAQDARAQAIQKAQEAARYYEQATNLSPHNAQLWNEWGSLLWDNLRDFEGAVAKYQKSLELDQQYDQTYSLLTNLYYDRAQLATGRDEKLKYYQQLIPYGEKAVQLSPKLATAWDGLSVAYVELGRCQDGITTTLRLIALLPANEPTIWNAHRNLAVSYRDCGRYPEALNEAQKALDLAPEPQKPMIQELINDVRTRMGAAAVQTP